MVLSQELHCLLYTSSKQGDDAKEAGNDNKNVTAYPQTESASERVIAQKQAGRYAVAYHPIGGMVPAQKFGEIYAVIKDRCV